MLSSYLEFRVMDKTQSFWLLYTIIRNLDPAHVNLLELTTDENYSIAEAEMLIAKNLILCSGYQEVHT
jgi:hypothetical protein